MYSSNVLAMTMISPQAFVLSHHFKQDVSSRDKLFSLPVLFDQDKAQNFCHPLTSVSYFHISLFFQKARRSYLDVRDSHPSHTHNVRPRIVSNRSIHRACGVEESSSSILPKFSDALHPPPARTSVPRLRCPLIVTDSATHTAQS